MKQILPLASDWKVMHAEPWLGPTQACSALPLADRWVPATVPGDVHLDYERAGLIADPFFGTNHDHIRWMEEWEWWYRTEVTPPTPAPTRTTSAAGLNTYRASTVATRGAQVAPAPGAMPRATTASTGSAASAASATATTTSVGRSLIPGGRTTGTRSSLAASRDYRRRRSARGL